MLCTHTFDASFLLQLQGGTVYFTGKKAVAANGGQKVKLYTPVTWQPGSSYSHWDLNVWSGIADKRAV